MSRPRVFLDFSIDNQPVGRVIFELFSDTASKTCENFRALCTGEKGRSSWGNLLHYKNCPVHRSIKGFMIQSGDFTQRNGKGGESIYGGTFADEDLQRPVDKEGLICMANKGPNTNESQFFITLRPCPHLDGKHVVFGHIIRGYEDVVQRISEVPVDANDRPTVPVTIHNCGELELRRKRRELSLNRRDNQLKRSNTALDYEDFHMGRSRLYVEHSQKKKVKYGQLDEKPMNTQHKEGIESILARETEKEYDTRLEREEQERWKVQRRRELERIKSELNAGEQTANGVRFKGRGRMKYIDPEVVNNRRTLSQLPMTDYERTKD